MNSHRSHNKLLISLESRKDFISRVYSEHWADLCKGIQKKFGNGPPDPEDIVQTAFVRFFAIDSPENVESPRGYLWRTAYNLVMDCKRHKALVDEHKSGARVASQESVVVNEIDAERVLLARQEYLVVRDAIEKLPARQREVIVLNRIENLSYAEVARRTGMPVTTVKRTVANVLVALDEALEEPAANRKRSDGSARE